MVSDHTQEAIWSLSKQTVQWDRNPVPRASSPTPDRITGTDADDGNWKYSAPPALQFRLWPRSIGWPADMPRPLSTQSSWKDTARCVHADTRFGLFEHDQVNYNETQTMKRGGSTIKTDWIMEELAGRGRNAVVRYLMTSKCRKH